MDKLFNEFNNPSAEYRGKPFWSWNGKLEKEELIRQVHVMKEMGFGGFFMHSRTGLETEYLGEEWFELINACADEAEKLGMEAWLYDEDRWPSGIAGGMVTENPEYRMKSIKLTVVDKAEQFNWEDDILAAFACNLDGVEVYEYSRIHDNTPPEVYCDKQILVFKIIEMSKHSFYNGFTYVDTLNRKATEKFIELTHEKYRQKCGDRLGKSIKGIFTDEPHRGTLMDEFGAGNDGDIWRAPWTGLLPEKFIAMYGYDLVEKLPELFLKLEGENVSQVKWQYIELLQQMFLENFAKPIKDWCEENNIILTGHVLHEDSLTAQTSMSGSVMRYYEYMGYPGVDLLTEGNKVYWVAKQLSSAARQLGKKWLLSELYGCTGWQMNFESHKAVGDWQALFGINLRCHHLSWYTMEGEAKRDYPASILHQSTWWKEYNFVEEYFSRMGLFMSQGKPCCDILLLNPIESVWSQVHPGWAKMLGANAPEISELEEKYRDLFFWLSEGHIDFDYGDEEMISRYYHIEQDLEGKPCLKIGEACYKAVVIGGMTTIRSSTLKIINEFIQAGGKVVVCGDSPAYVDATPSQAAQELLKLATTVAFKSENLINALSDIVSCRVKVVDSEGINIKDIFCQMRYDSENKYIMFLNINREKGYKNVKIQINSMGSAEEWICSSGERFALSEIEKDGTTEIITDFEPCKEHLYIIRQKAVTQLQLQNNRPIIEKEKYTLSGPYEYEIDEPNVCVLDMARYKIDDGEWQAEKEILKVDQAVRNSFCLPLRGGEMLQPWFAKKHEFNVKGKLSLQFDFHIDILPQDQVELVLERAKNFEISVNGQDIDNSILSGWWIDKCFNKILLPEGILRKGRNTVELKVDFHEGINLEAIFLIGRFGVKVEGSKNTLILLPPKVIAGDLTTQGLPYYSGKIQYKMKINSKTQNTEKVILSLEQFEGACVKIIAFDKSEKMIAWQPYDVDITDSLKCSDEIRLEIVLTRRNTFGPLHQIPLIAQAYGPLSFLSEGDQFTNNYMLIPSGLLKEPIVKFLQLKG